MNNSRLFADNKYELRLKFLNLAGGYNGKQKQKPEQQSEQKRKQKQPEQQPEQERKQK